MPSLTRRTLLQASGVAVSLPLLEATQPAAFSDTATSRRRMVAVNVGLGLHGPNIVPQQAGRDYELPTYLQVLKEHRDNFTFISGSSHPEVGGGHASGKSFLTAAKHPNSAGFQNSISLDQYAADRLGAETRFRSLSLTSSGPGLSWSRSGVEIPATSFPSRVFKQLFLEGKPSEKAHQVQRLKDGQSVLDVVMDKANRMQQKLSGRDRDKIDQYFNAVREAEQRLVKAEAWEHRPKPKVDVAAPRDEPDRTKMIERADLIYDMMHLALETDSTRFITFYDTGMNAVPTIPGVDTDYHMLSHHGKDPTKIEQLTIVETEMIKSLGRFLSKLTASQEGGSTLLDSTMVLFGSNLGNASSHDTKNMPILLAGGGFRHGQHLQFDSDNNYPLPKLYVSMLQRLGIETDEFADAAGTMDGLEMA
ncbi:DUF1552 domain-containing protein [Fuerstiella marisgermanici]|uniref:Secreted protein containing DUF1552 n=1 Tax=Fuerstiella marisgermanici TaxID=1891926 RepID=A0A1P8WSH8_9PLAN|nr:DUF1552 domain-containing protein [Fuerstiella marisgermanici]APZ97027.1 hypothetical protein Fuma_06705 [Fuerstiella marisgermanici]